jgi:hypothetical protein
MKFSYTFHGFVESIPDPFAPHERSIPTGIGLLEVNQSIHLISKGEIAIPKFNAQKHWWVVIVAIGVITTALYLIAEQWFPALIPISAFLTMGLLGAGFCWAYAIDKEKQWWAIIPSLALFIILIISVAVYTIGVETKDQWINVLALGVGAAIIGAVLRRKPAKLTLYIIALFIFLVGILMSPVAILLKVLLIAVDVLILGYFAWRNRT